MKTGHCWLTNIFFTWKQAGCECPQAPGQFLAEIHNTGHCWKCSTGEGHSGVHVVPWNFSPHFLCPQTVQFCCHKYGREPHPAWLRPHSSLAAYWWFRLWKTAERNRGQSAGHVNLGEKHLSCALTNPVWHLQLEDHLSHCTTWALCQKAYIALSIT